jgi:hypothetical protein
MNRFLIILVFIQLTGYSAKSQENHIEFSISVYNHPLEKEFLSEYANDPFILLQSLYPKEEINSGNWNKLVNKLDKGMKKNNKNVQLLSDIFFSTHQLILKNYAKFSHFSQTLDEGVYDCVTGTASLALMLERYEIPYRIIETDEHVFIKGDLDGIPFIFESTFPIEGLIIDPEKIKNFEESYIGIRVNNKKLRNHSEVGTISEETNFNFLYNIIDLKQLAGLQYYNDAIKKFHEDDFQAAYAQLIKAEFLYPSERILDLKGKVQMVLGIVSVKEPILH